MQQIINKPELSDEDIKDMIVIIKDAKLYSEGHTAAYPDSRFCKEQVVKCNKFYKLFQDYIFAKTYPAHEQKTH